MAAASGGRPWRRPVRRPGRHGKNGRPAWLPTGKARIFFEEGNCEAEADIQLKKRPMKRRQGSGRNRAAAGSTFIVK